LAANEAKLPGPSRAVPIVAADSAFSDDDAAPSGPDLDIAPPSVESHRRLEKLSLLHLGPSAKMRANPLLGCICCLAVILVAGCGPKYSTGAGVKLKGRIVKGGQPLQITGPSGTAWVEVNIFPANAAEASKLADTSVQTEPDGSFFIDYEGRGVPPGKYKLAVFQRNLGPGSDQLNGKFSQESTTLTVDADSSKVGSTVDLGTIELDKGGK
jgi:hypothetical protein